MTSFAALGIHPDIIRGLEELGFTEPTPVQEQVIPTALEERADLVVLAQTGTGKTGAFGIPLLQLCDPGRKKPQALVLCPTRELCLQVARDLAGFSRFQAAITVVPVYGGAPIDRQIKALRQGVQIIVATPGRLHDLLRRGVADLSALHAVVLDEADEMLQMGFQDELNAILGQTPDNKTCLLFSATMPREVAGIAGRYMRRPREIVVGRRNGGVDTVSHLFYLVQARDRYPALRRIADSIPGLYAIIFCRTRQETQEVADRLVRDGYRADALHGDLSQGQRDQVMNKFRCRQVELLVATDVAARGLDVHDLTHVINYNLPDSADNYTHRSGRTGRAGKAGVSIALIHLKEQYKIREIASRLKVKFKKARVPTGLEVCEKRLLGLIDTVEAESVDHAAIEPFWPVISARLAGLERDELIKRFVSLAFKETLAAYRNAPDLNVPDSRSQGPPKQQPGPGPDRHGGRTRFTRFRLNVGYKDGMQPRRLIGQINEIMGPRIRVGKIEVSEHTTMLEADSRFSPQVVRAFQYLMINGKHVVIETGRDREEKGLKTNSRKPFKKTKPFGLKRKQPRIPAKG
ncbi:MAG: DEAD/DEAH box helicase [Desulfobacterales bacterium]|nr:DEAD/DEAH box helicase [Desulfobacterales bacterium]